MSTPFVVLRRVRALLHLRLRVLLLFRHFVGLCSLRLQHRCVGCPVAMAWHFFGVKDLKVVSLGFVEIGDGAKVTDPFVLRMVESTIPNWRAIPDLSEEQKPPTHPTMVSSLGFLLCQML